MALLMNVRLKILNQYPKDKENSARFIATCQWNLINILPKIPLLTRTVPTSLVKG
jgi:hypothetical protein